MELAKVAIFSECECAFKSPLGNKDNIQLKSSKSPTELGTRWPLLMLIVSSRKNRLLHFLSATAQILH